MRREDDSEVERAANANSGVVLMTAAVSNLKRLSSSVVRFSATDSENEDEIEAMRSVRGRGQGRDRALSFSSKTARIRFSEDLQRCILPVYPPASASSASASASKRDAHDFGTVSSLIGSAAVSSFAPTNEEPPPCAISEYFKHNFRKLEVRIAVLGAPGVGKTSIVERFVSNRFSSVYRATVARRLHYPVMVSAKSLFELKVCDCPPIEHFTLNNASRRTAWTRYIGTGLKDASVFVLVYDVTSEDSFDFVAHLREEMVAYFDAQKEAQVAADTPANTANRRVPIIVVGNKRDLQNGTKQESYTPHERRSIKQKLSTCTFDSDVPTFGTSDFTTSEDGNELRIRSGTVRERTVHRRSPTNRSISSLQIQPQDSQKRYRSRSRLLKKLSSVSNPMRYGEGYNAIVTRNWKALHIECSAKYNWNITHIFQEIVKIVEDDNGDLSRKSSRKGATIRQHCNKCAVS